VQELVIVLKKKKFLSPPPVWKIFETFPTLQACGKFLESSTLLKKASPTTTEDSKRLTIPIKHYINSSAWNL
jgi:hypothetical protein